MYSDSFCSKIIPAQFYNMAANKEADPEMSLFIEFIRNTKILNTNMKVQAVIFSWNVTCGTNVLNRKKKTDK